MTGADAPQPMLRKERRRNSQTLHDRLYNANESLRQTTGEAWRLPA